MNKFYKENIFKKDGFISTFDCTFPKQYLASDNIFFLQFCAVFLLLLLQLNPNDYFDFNLFRQLVDVDVDAKKIYK